MAGSMESGPGLLHIRRRCHGVVGRTQGEPTYIHTYVTVWPGEVGRGGGGNASCFNILLSPKIIYTAAKSY